METYDAHKTATQARQASRTHANFWVLVLSTAIVVAAFCIIYLLFFAGTPPNAVPA